MKRYLYRIVQSIRTALPEEAVARTARATGLVQRAREIGSVPFLWSFLFGTTQPGGSVTKVRNFYEVFTNHEAAYSSIQQWITSELKQLLIELIAHLSVELGTTEPALGGRFDRFRDISSRMRLTARFHLIASKIFPDTATIMLEHGST